MVSEITDQDLLPVRITRKTMVNEDLCLFDLAAVDGGALPAFTAGAHVAIRTPAGGMRQFSLCNDPAQTGHYQLGVKAERSGRGGSASLIDDTREGDDILVSGPMNNFSLIPTEEYLFIAGGIGITPIMSMIRQVAREGTARFRLIYCTRSPETTPFLDDLNAPNLKSNVTIHHDEGDPDRAYDFWDLFEKPGKSHVYCCGPAALMEEIKGVSGHWRQSNIHFEDFQSGVEAVRADDRPFVVRNARTGKIFPVDADTTILESLRAAGQNFRSSCESGTCGTCKTRLVEGDADHRDLALTDEEKADHILVCVSRSFSDELVLDW